MPPHRYTRADGTEIPSVSTVIGQCKSTFRSAQVEAGAELGSYMHALIERSMGGEPIDSGEVSAEGAPAWAAYQEWRFERSPEAERVPPIGERPALELSLTTPEAVPLSAAYGGTIDMVIRVAGKGGAVKRVLVDAKTRTASPKLSTPDRHTLSQLGGYSVLWRLNYPEMPLDGAMVLVLARNAPVYRECWVGIDELGHCEREFLALRLALGEHEARKAKLGASWREERAADRAASKGKAA